LNKFTQDSFSKLYNSNILKSTTPQYVKNNIISNNLKENIFRTYTQESYPASNSNNTKATIENLYQKAKYEVLNHKLRVTTSTNPARYQMKNNSNSSLSTTKREETPKDVVRKVNFNNFYGSPDVAMDKSSKILGHSSQNNLAKKDSVRAFQMGVTYKKSSDTPIYASYDFSSQPKIAKKPNFKLDLNKRGQASR